MIVATNNGGLANRMRCIASCYKFSENKTLEYSVKWKVLDDYGKNTHILNCPFNMLFSNDIEYKGVKDSNYEYNSHCLLIEDRDSVPNGFNTFVSGCRVRFATNDRHGRNIDFMYKAIPDGIKNRYINAFGILSPIPELMDKINHFASKNFDKNTVSVHIRSWNRNGEASRRNDLHKLEKYESEMRKHEGCRFYISTDSSSVIEYFKNNKQWMDRVIFYDRKTDLDTSRDFPEGVQEDLIELYLLSRNNYLIGSRFSTFSEVAWWLGKCMDVVIV